MDLNRRVAVITLSPKRWRDQGEAASCLVTNTRNCTRLFRPRRGPAPGPSAWRGWCFLALVDA